MRSSYSGAIIISSISSHLGAIILSIHSSHEGIIVLIRHYFIHTQPLPSFRDYHAQLTFLLFTTQQTLLLFWCCHNQQPLLSFRDYHTRPSLLLFILSRNSGVIIPCKHSFHSRINKLRGLLDFFMGYQTHPTSLLSVHT
jgi:hypothetical protein